MKLFVLLFCALLLIGCNKETTKQPNILVFIADDAGHLGSNEWLKTPGIIFLLSLGPTLKP
jgi:hypothetical protein